MNTSFKRIQGDNIQYGSSFVLSGETAEESNNNLLNHTKLLQKEIDKKQKELDDLNKSLEDLFSQKDEIIINAKKSAENIKTNAVLEAEEIISNANAQKNVIEEEAKKQGQKQGFEAGYNDGFEKLKSDYTKQLNALNILADASFKVKNEIVYSSETEILELALLIAEKILQIKFENDIATIKNMTQTALSLLKEKENVKLVVNPKIIGYIKEFIPEFEQNVDDISSIKIIQDKAISPDGVVVESVNSRIDARISTQLETLARTLLIDKREHTVITDEIDTKINLKTEELLQND